MEALQQFNSIPTAEVVDQLLRRVGERVSQNQSVEVYKQCLSMVDLTTLSCCDNEESVREFARAAVRLGSEHPELPQVAGICVYPPFVESVAMEIDGSPIRIVAVSGGFPASQTFMEVKALESAMAVENGADEVDIVLNVGKVLCGRFEEAASEVELLREEIDEDVTLKVIIESGELKSYDLIYKASMLSMCAGADFIKTSTGKTAIGAAPEAAVVMALAIKEYYAATGKRVGLKVAGGVKSNTDAALYYTIVEEVLGEEWLVPELFRIGASSLCAALCEAIG
ncbi:MAG: deoxyribose-phosphate aldolase [Rikenellaceae bacterium]